MKPMTNSSDSAQRTYETTDLMLASFLRCRDLQIADIRRQNGRTVFVFGDSPQLRQAIIDYANDAQVSVRSFCATMRDLKAITR
jgi:hypothetical protein